MSEQEFEFGQEKWMETVLALITKAEHPTTPPEEAELCRKKADAIMTKHAFDQAMLDQSRPTSERSKPGMIKVDIGSHDNPFIYEIMMLGTTVGEHCRCRVIWIQTWSGNDRLEVFGFKSDLEYWQMLFTQLYVHMSRIFWPKIDPAKTLEENAYDFHNAGLNWIDIAELYGWVKLPRATCDEAYGGKVMFVNQYGDVEPITMVGSRVKRAYYRHIFKLGESPVIIPPAKSRQSGKLEFRKNAVRGYVSEIKSRFLRISQGREPGTELVLRDRSHEIDDLIADLGYELGTATDGSDVPYNQEAYARGRIHAQSANLSVSAGVARGSAGEIR